MCTSYNYILLVGIITVLAPPDVSCQLGCKYRKYPLISVYGPPILDTHLDSESRNQSQAKTDQLKKIYPTYFYITCLVKVFQLPVSEDMTPAGVGRTEGDVWCSGSPSESRDSRGGDVCFRSPKLCNVLSPLPSTLTPYYWCGWVSTPVPDSFHACCDLALYPDAGSWPRFVKHSHIDSLLS